MAIEPIRLAPGVITSGLVAALAHAVGSATSLPSMLLALLFGLSLNPLLGQSCLQPGAMFASKGLLRLAVGLLGARLSYDLMLQVGLYPLMLTVAAVLSTLGFGILMSKLLGMDRSVGILTAGSVAICGASAAVAISAVLPHRKTGEEALATTVFGVTVLSTVAMILYPLIASWFAFSDTESGIFFGASIHDVAQVVGAGLIVSEEAGTIASLVKLFRVSLLAPVVICVSLYFLRANAAVGSVSGRTPLVPGFVVLFLCLAVLNSLGLIPPAVREGLIIASGWGLLTAIAAVGMRTSFCGLWSQGSQLLVLIVAETVFIALLVLALL